MHADALSFLEISLLKQWYSIEKWKIFEEEAKKYMKENMLNNEDIETDD